MTSITPEMDGILHPQRTKDGEQVSKLPARQDAGEDLRGLKAALAGFDHTERRAKWLDQMCGSSLVGVGAVLFVCLVVSEGKQQQHPPPRHFLGASK